MSTKTELASKIIELEEKIKKLEDQEKFALFEVDAARKEAKEKFRATTVTEVEAEAEKAETESEALEQSVAKRLDAVTEQYKDLLALIIQ
jgi:outer membrane murein-binding lipoprotein Lpp